jgi:hypothetical protein
MLKFQRKIDFEIAKKASLQIRPGVLRRCISKVQDRLQSNYVAMKSADGISYVIGDSYDDIPFPDQIISGRPAARIDSIKTKLKI